jgi:uncharacterized membrane protein YkvA (DUF1232 family)
MESFWDFSKWILVCFTGTVIIFLILLSIPNSKLKGIALKVFSKILYVFTTLTLFYVISPVDLIPEVIPLLGQVDDALALVLGVVVFLPMAIISGLEGKKIAKGLKAAGELVREIKSSKNDRMLND